jgi:hypothetical protein
LIVTRSGFATPTSAPPYLGSLNTPDFDDIYSGGVSFISMEAPPPGQVLWLSLAINWHLFKWRRGNDPSNNSSRPMRVDFGSHWRWALITSPYTTESILFMEDQGRYEHYTSIPPGGKGFDVSWLVPARTLTLTPDSKVSDPTPLELLLRTQVDGWFHLQLRTGGSDLVINGRPQEFPVGGYHSGVHGLNWSWAVRVQKRPVTKPGAARLRRRRRA